MIVIEIDSKHFPHRGANVSIKLSCDKHTWIRTFHCGNMTTNQAELKGIEYALMSIADNYRSDEIVLRTSGRYGIMMLGKNMDGAWIKSSSNYSSIVDRIRELFNGFSRIQIEFCNDLIDLRESNLLAVKSGEQIFKKL